MEKFEHKKSTNQQKRKQNIEEAKFTWNFFLFDVEDIWIKKRRPLKLVSTNLKPFTVIWLL